ncbi:MAG: hypothetical protein ACREVR_09720 [Burkholderiales bacterium]
MQPIKRFVLLACVLATSACAQLNTASSDPALVADYLSRCELMTGTERLACFDLFAPRAPGDRPGRN